MSIDGVLSYLAMAIESEWGTAGTNKVLIPVDSYDGRFNAENRQGAQFLGIHQRKYSRNFRGMPSGAMALPLWSYWIPSAGAGNDMSIAQYLLTWALSNLDSTFMASRTIDWAEGPNEANLRHTGMRVNSFTLSGDMESGLISLSIESMGQDEATFATMVTLPTDWENLPHFDFADMTLTVDSTEVNPTAFQLTGQFGQSPKYLNSRTPLVMNRTQCALDFQFSILKEDDTYPALERATSTDADLDIQLDFVGLHNGTGSSGTNTTLEIDMPKCRFVKNNDARARDLLVATIQTHLLKPETSENSIILTWGVS
jgi:hypothetical protein